MYKAVQFLLGSKMYSKNQLQECTLSNNHEQFPRKVGFSSTIFFLFGAINGTRIAIKVATIYPAEN